MTETFRAYKNTKTGHTCFLWSNGMIECNGRPCDEVPEWLSEGSVSFKGKYGPTITHHGGMCPVLPDRQIVARTRDGQFPYIGPAIWPDHKSPHEMWLHAPARKNGNADFDIVGYNLRIDT